MNILIFNFEYPPLGGGGGVATSQLSEELAKRHTVHVITTHFENLPKEELLHGVHIHRVKVLGRKNIPTSSLLSLLTFAPSALFAGIRIIRQHSFQVINAQFVIPSGLPAAILAQWFQIPFVLSFIGGDLYDPSKRISPHRHALLRWIIRRIASLANAKTAISQDTKTRAIELHGISPSISVVPIGLVPSNTAPAHREQYGVPADAFLCISVGRLVTRKGYETLIRAFANVPNAHLIIIGDGPLKERLESLITDLGLVSRVHLLGYVEETQKHALLKCSNLYVSAAQHEGFGIVFLEAMDTGLAIVAANDGGQKDFLEHGKNALLVPPYDADKISGAIQELMVDVSERTRMQEHNTHDVKKYYVEHTTKMFEKILVDTVQTYEHHN